MKHFSFVLAALFSMAASADIIECTSDRGGYTLMLDEENRTGELTRADGTIAPLGSLSCDFAMEDGMRWVNCVSEGKPVCAGITVNLYAAEGEVLAGPVNETSFAGERRLGDFRCDK